MTNFATVKSITDNLQSVLKTQGIHFDRKVFEDDKNIPASFFPCGEIFYNGEEFEYTHGERPGYAEINYGLRVMLQERDPVDAMREQQKWAHKIREALTVSAMNVTDLAASKLVSRVTTEAVDVDNLSARAVLNYRLKVRYREA